MTPFEILGIEPTTSDSDIKRAYARKLKVTRPDEDPAGFQALHEAREAALDWARFEREWGDSQDAEDDEASDGAPPAAGATGFGFGGMALNSGLLTVLAMEARRPGSANQHLTEELDRVARAESERAQAGDDAGPGRGGQADAGPGVPPAGAAGDAAAPEVIRIEDGLAGGEVDADGERHATGDEDDERGQGDGVDEDDGDDDGWDDDADEEADAARDAVLDEVMQRLERCLDDPWAMGDLASWNALAKLIEDQPLGYLPLMQYRVLVALEHRFRDTRWRTRISDKPMVGEGIALIAEVFGWNERDRAIYDTIDPEPADDLVTLIRSFSQQWHRPGQAGFVRGYRGDVAVVEPAEFGVYFDSDPPEALMGYYQRCLTAERWLGEFNLWRAIAAPVYLAIHRLWRELGFWASAVGVAIVGAHVPALAEPPAGGTSFASVALGLVLAIHVAVGAYGARMVLTRAVKRVEEADSRGLSDPHARRAFLAGHGRLPKWLRYAVALGAVALLGVLIIGPARLAGIGPGPMDPPGQTVTFAQHRAFQTALAEITRLDPSRATAAAEALGRGEEEDAAVTAVEAAFALGLATAKRRSHYHALHGTWMALFHLVGPQKAEPLMARLAKPAGQLAGLVGESGLPVETEGLDPVAVDYLHDVFAVCALDYYQADARALIAAGDEVIWERIVRIAGQGKGAEAGAALRALLDRPECTGRQAALQQRLKPRGAAAARDG